MKSDLLVINTGGTFGMVESPNGLAPAGDLKRRILETVSSLDSAEFELYELEPLIDSSDLSPTDWSRIAQTVVDHLSDYEGFIVIHGTDTLAYTAAALSLIFAGINKPIIVTGSQIPLTQSGSDAPSNFLDSLSVAKDAEMAGVHVCFGGKILLGSRVRKLDAQGFSAFDTPNLQSFIAFDQPKPEQRFTVPQFKPAAVATIFIYPGIPAAILNGVIDEGRTEALVLLSFGSGNLPTLSSDFLMGLARAHEKGILIVNLTQCLRGKVIQGAYATGSALAEMGALDGKDLTPEAAFARMHYLLATCENKKAVVDLWPQPLCGELSP